jgi:hypothetical protein
MESVGCINQMKAAGDILSQSKQSLSYLCHISILCPDIDQ